MSDDLLGPLRDEPVPPLASPASVRARGEQRTRRRRAALAGSAAVVVLAAGVGLTGPRGADELRPDRFATAAPSPTSSQAPLEAALLRPEDVARVLPGEWNDLPDESPFSVPLVGCPAIAREPEPEATRFLTDGGRIVGQALSQLPDERAADKRYQQVLASLRACGESSPSYRLLGEGGDTSTRTYGELLTPGEAARPFSLERVGRVVVTLVLQGLAEPSPELTQAAADRVREVLPADSEPSPSPSTAAPVASLPLTPEDADRAEPGSWEVSDQTGADPKLLDPCTGGTRYPRDADRVATAATGLFTRREAGGTSLTQTVARYPDAATARDAAEGYERAVRGCPQEEGGEEIPGSRRSHEVVEEYSEIRGVRTLYVRSEGGCDTCVPDYRYYAVQQVGDVVSVVVVTVGEDGDPGVDLVRPFAEQVAQRLTA